MKAIIKQLPLPRKIALRLLIDNVEDNNDFILLLSRWNNNENDWRNGVVSRDNYEISRNKINHAFNQMVDELSFDDLEKVIKASEQKLVVKKKSKPKQAKKKSIDIQGNDNIVISDVSDSEININIGNALDKMTETGGGFDIEKLKEMMDTPVVKPRPASTASQSKVQTILFLAANPSKKAELNLRIEHSIISEELEDMEGFDFESKFSVSIKEMNMEVVSTEPSILHFSGHGLSGNESDEVIIDEMGVTMNNDTGLVFHNDEKNGTDILSPIKCGRIFDSLKNMVPSLKIVVLNACYSEQQAIAISKNDIYTIGTSNTIQNKVATAFSQGFYWRYAKTADIISSVLFGKLQADTELLDRNDGNVDDLIHLFYGGERIEI